MLYLSDLGFLTAKTTDMFVDFGRKLNIASKQVLDIKENTPSPSKVAGNLEETDDHFRNLTRSAYIPSKTPEKYV